MELQTDEFVGSARVLHRGILDPTTVLRSQPSRIVSVKVVLFGVTQVDQADLIVEATCLELVPDPAWNLSVALDVHQN